MSFARRHYSCLLWILCIVVVGVMCWPDASYAQPLPAATIDGGGGGGGGSSGPPMEKVCNTDLPDEANDMGRIFEGVGIISTLTGEIGALLDQAWRQLYDGILSSRFPGIVWAMVTIYVIVFGIMYALGLVQMPLNEAVKRTVKVSFVGAIIGTMTYGGDGSSFFERYIHRFFRDGFDELMVMMVTEITNRVSSNSTGSDCAVGGEGVILDSVQQVFAPMDQLICELIRPGTLMILEGALNTPPWGLAFLLVTVGGGLYLAGAIARAMWVYLMSLVATTFLFGLAPIFLSFILFERTKGMFNGWLSQLVNFTIQPLLMFTFISFFLVMMYQVLDTSLLDAEVCYGPASEFVQNSGPRGKTSTIQS